MEKKKVQCGLTIERLNVARADAYVKFGRFKRFRNQIRDKQQLFIDLRNKYASYRKTFL